jgi:hypothetical protein
MQSVCVATTVRVGNHLLTAEETAAGVAPRKPFVDGAGAPVDPDHVALSLTAAGGATRTFGYPAAGPTDAGVLTREATGRFYVDWAPGLPADAGAEDGLWRWFLVGAMTLGSAQSDQDVFYVRREIAPGAAGG